MGKNIGFLLNIIAIGLLIPGITLPIFNLNMEMIAGVSQSNIQVTMIDDRLSIVTTIEELWSDQRTLVAILIGLFSIAIPIAKFFAVVAAFIKRNTELERQILKIIASIGKWSMADVFVVAIFLAVLSTNHADTTTQHNLTLLNFTIPVDISSQTVSTLGNGFYYFLSYCLLSLLGTHLMLSGINQNKN